MNYNYNKNYQTSPEQTFDFNYNFFYRYAQHCGFVNGYNQAIYEKSFSQGYQYALTTNQETVTVPKFYQTKINTNSNCGTCSKSTSTIYTTTSNCGYTTNSNCGYTTTSNCGYTTTSNCGTCSKSTSPISISASGAESFKSVLKEHPPNSPKTPVTPNPPRESKVRSLIFTDDDTISDFSDISGDLFHISDEESKDDIKQLNIFTVNDKITPINTNNLESPSPSKIRHLPPLPPPAPTKEKKHIFNVNSSWDNFNKTIKYKDIIFSSEEEEDTMSYD